MSEQAIGDHQIPVLDQQTVRVLMRQVLGRQEIELLRFQVHPVTGWTGPATRGMYQLAGTGYGCFLYWLSQIIDESLSASWERRTGHRIDQCLENQARLIYYLLDLADEARLLINSV